MIRAVTLLTDFGMRDGYVAQMKAAVLAVCSDCHLIDITHENPPQDIASASRTLRRTALRFPKGSVHVAVVDPGVGTDRSVIAASIAGHYFVAPDNGLLSELVLDFTLEACVEISQASAESYTFHGRDIMAPAAARLAAGEPLDRLGSPLARQLVVLSRYRPTVDEHSAESSVEAIDHFGNASLATSAELAEWLERAVGERATLRLSLGGDCSDEETVNIECCRTYGEQAAGALILLRGSQLDWELAIVNGSAAEKLGLSVGQLVSLRA